MLDPPEISATVTSNDDVPKKKKKRKRPKKKRKKEEETDNASKDQSADSLAKRTQFERRNIRF
jgi:hypothetical protein